MFSPELQILSLNTATKNIWTPIGRFDPYLGLVAACIKALEYFINRLVSLDSPLKVRMPLLESIRFIQPSYIMRRNRQ